jgi:hypothetical protein
MLFGPEDGERFRDPEANGSEPMQARVADSADGDQQIGVADAGMPVMNMEAIPRPAAAAPELIAREDDFPVPSEVCARMPAGAVAAGAEAGNDGRPFAAGAKQRLLPGTCFPASPQKAFLAIAEG